MSWPHGSASLAVVPQLVALAAAGWLVGEYLAGHRWLSVIVLAAIQLFVHVTLDATKHPAPVAAPMPMDHSSMHDHMPGMTMPAATETAAAPMHASVTDALTMTAAHLVVLLAGVVLIGSTHRWAQRVLRILARLVPQLPAAVIPLPAVRAALPGVPERPRFIQQPAHLERLAARAPQYRVQTVPS